MLLLIINLHEKKNHKKSRQVCFMSNSVHDWLKMGVFSCNMSAKL